MFKLAQTDTDVRKIRTFCSQSFFGARINTASAAYGTDERFVRTWYEEENGEIHGVMQLTEDNAVVQCTREVDIDSLCSLLQFAGARHVTGEAQIMQRMPFTVTNSGVLMQAQTLADRPTTAQLLTAEQLKPLFAVLFPDKDVQIDRRLFASWYADVSHRVRHGLCDFFAVLQDGEVLSCAGTVYSNAKYGCIGAVATLAAHRHKGFAGECTLAAAQSVVQSGLTPCLACENDLVQMYAKLGFSVCGEWCEVHI